MSEQTSAEEFGLVGRDRVIATVQEILRDAAAMGWSLEKIAERSQLKLRYVKCIKYEDKMPNSAALLSIAAVLGEWAVARVMALIGYQASPLEPTDALNPNAIVAGCARGLSAIAAAAADGRFDHVEMPAVTEAADLIIATVLPVSSAGKR